MFAFVNSLNDTERWIYGICATAFIVWSGQWFAQRLSHSLAIHRQKLINKANAAAAFRSSVHQATRNVPSAHVYWGNDDIALVIAACSDIGTSVLELKPFLGSKGFSFSQEWDALQKHCNEEIPKALSGPEIMHGGGPEGVKKAKERFFWLFMT